MKNEELKQEVLKELDTFLDKRINQIEKKKINEQVDTEITIKGKAYFLLPKWVSDELTQMITDFKNKSVEIIIERINKKNNG